MESSRLLAPESLGLNENEMLLETNSAWFRAVVNLTASTLGTGLLSLPGACKSTGLIFFVLASLAAAWACHTTAQFLVRTAKFLTGRLVEGEDSTYAGLAGHVYGDGGERLVQVGLVLQQIGACVGYIVVVGDVFQPLFRVYTGVDFSQTMVRNVFVWFFMFPLTIGTKNLASLEYASLAAVVAISLFCFTVCANWFWVVIWSNDPMDRQSELLRGREEQNDGKISNDPIILEGPHFFPQHVTFFIRSIPLVSFAFDMAFNALPVYVDMKVDVYPPKSPIQVYASASAWAFLLSLIASVAIGITGYLTFLSETKPDLLTNFSVHGSFISSIMNVVRSFYGIGLALAFPLLVWELRQVLFVLTLGEPSPSRWMFWVGTTGIFLLTSVLVLAVDNITTVFGLVGSTVTPSLDYVFPALLYLHSGCAAKYDEELKAKIICLCGIILIPLGLGVWIAERFDN